MKLTLHDVAQMFDVPERTVERWIRDEGLPCTRIHDRYRFHRAQLLEWANARGIRIASDAPMSERSRRALPLLSDALAVGGMHYDVAAKNREEALRALVSMMPETEDLDHETLLDFMLAREETGSTGIGDGIAIPHVRNPVVLEIDRPSVGVCFLREPIDFNAIDGKPVHTLFWLVTPTVRSHLTLLSRLAAALFDPGFKRALLDRAPAERILEAARRVEQALPDNDDDDDEGEP